MKILHCNLCVKRGRVECKPEDLMQIKMTGKPYCENVLRLKGSSTLPSVRFCQNHLEEPLDKLLQTVENNPREPFIGYFDYIKKLNKALEKENSK